MCNLEFVAFYPFPEVSCLGRFHCTYIRVVQGGFMSHNNKFA